MTLLGYLKNIASGQSESIIVPTCHLNGTSPDVLFEAYSCEAGERGIVV